MKIEFDPNRSTLVASIFFEDGDVKKIISPIGIKRGKKIISRFFAPIEIGNNLPFWNIPIGTVIHRVQAYSGSLRKFARSSGFFSQIINITSGQFHAR